MQRSKSRRDLTDEIDFSDKMLNALSLARGNASRASSRDSFRSVQEPYWNYESGGWGNGTGGGARALDPGGGAILKRRSEARTRSHSADGPRKDKKDNFMSKFKNFSENLKQYQETDRSRPRQRMTTQTRPTPAPRTDVHVVEDDDGHEEPGGRCNGECNQQYRQTQDVQYVRDLGDRYGDDRRYDEPVHTNKHRIPLPRFEPGPVNLNQVKKLTQVMGEKFNYDGKRGAADFIDNTVNMFKSQVMSADTFKFLVYSLLDSAAKKKLGKVDIHGMTPDAFVEKLLRRLDDSSTLDELEREFYSKEPTGESVSDWFEILENSGIKAKVPQSAIWQRFLTQIPIAMALPLDRELRYQLRRYGRYPKNGHQIIQDTLGEIVDSVKAIMPRFGSNKQNQETAPDKRYRPTGRGYVRLVDGQGPLEVYMDEQVKQQEMDGTAQYSTDKYRQEGEHVVCHDCPRATRTVRQCNNISSDSKKDTCLECGKSGHIESECWKNEVCKVCNKSGHIASKCWKNEVCEVCNKPGHIADVCRRRDGKDKNDRAGKQPRKDCTRCGAMQHKSSECPMYDPTLVHKEPCTICKNYFGRNYYHREDHCMVKKTLLRPMAGN